MFLSSRAMSRVQWRSALRPAAAGVPGARRALLSTAVQPSIVVVGATVMASPALFTRDSRALPPKRRAKQPVQPSRQVAAVRHAAAHAHTVARAAGHGGIRGQDARSE